MEGLEEGPVTFISGASRGIGKAIALHLGDQGARLVLGSRTRKECEEVAEEARARGADAQAVALDVADTASVEAAVVAAQEQFGTIHHLVNNAGIKRDGLLLRMKDEDWDSVLATDLGGVYRCTKAVLRSMVRQRYGRVVSISSIVALTGNAGQTNYAAAKAGVHGFTKALAREVSSRGITVNAVAPGYVNTEMTREVPEAVRERLLEQVPLGRLGTGEDVAGLVAFLLSSQADYITGQVICVDGGMSM